MTDQEITELRAEVALMKQRLFEADAYNGMVEAMEFNQGLSNKRINELQRRLDAIVEMLDPGPDDTPKTSVERWSHVVGYGDHLDALYYLKCEMHASAVAIAKEET